MFGVCWGFFLLPVLFVCCWFFVVFCFFVGFFVNVTSFLFARSEKDVQAAGKITHPHVRSRVCLIVSLCCFPALHAFSQCYVPLWFSVMCWYSFTSLCCPISPVMSDWVPGAVRQCVIWPAGLSKQKNVQQTKAALVHFECWLFQIRYTGNQMLKFIWNTCSPICNYSRKSAQHFLRCVCSKYKFILIPQSTFSDDLLFLFCLQNTAYLILVWFCRSFGGKMQFLYIALNLNQPHLEWWC